MELVNVQLVMVEAIFIVDHVTEQERWLAQIVMVMVNWHANIVMATEMLLVPVAMAVENVQTAMAVENVVIVMVMENVMNAMVPEIVLSVMGQV